MDSQIVIDGVPNDGIIAAFLALGLIFIIIFLVWAVVAYLLTAFALYNMAKADGVEDAFFAFIPFLNCKTWGDLIGKKLPQFMQPQSGWKLIGVYAACIIIGWIPFLHFISSVLLFALGVYIIYLLFERYTTNAVLYTVLHVITCSIFLPIHLFVIRNNEPRY
ncbi:hypothetical protein ACEOWJ_004238 [Bacillus cereus]|uniref:hypothetical protein n=1 Tax=Bacillus TaxID=1386 RepID=UPI00054E01F9|nr:hypothetical protein [Bacillus sp. UNC322MFChir4.1]